MSTKFNNEENAPKMNFNAAEVAPSQRDVLPAGKYTVSAEKAELKTTKDGTGSYLQFQFKIIEGEHRGRRLFTTFNLVNKNPKAVEIARGNLSAFCRAVGVLQPQTAADMFGIALMVKVVVKPATENFGEKNEIAAYYKDGGGKIDTTVENQEKLSEAKE